MAEFPVPLDNLISYVKALHPAGGPLENVSDAFAVSTQMDEQSDALIGYFVDQARRSGLSWSQIGGAMGVSKQAAQKRFVPTKAGDLFPPSAKPFSRFTDRAVRVIAAAGNLAAAEPIGAAHITAALLTEPEGVAAKAIAAAARIARTAVRRGRHRAGPAGHERQAGGALRAGLLKLELDNERQGGAEGLAQVGAAPRPQLHRHRAPAARGASRPARPATRCTAIGLSPQRAEELITAEIADFQARKEAN